MYHPFNTLGIAEKTLLLDDIGAHLLSIEFYDHRIHLYAMQDFLVELYYNIDTKSIDRISVAEKGDLDKFLAQITLPPFRYTRSKSAL